MISILKTMHYENDNDSFHCSRSDASTKDEQYHTRHCSSLIANSCRNELSIQWRIAPQKAQIGNAVDCPIVLYKLDRLVYNMSLKRRPSVKTGTGSRNEPSTAAIMKFRFRGISLPSIHVHQVWWVESMSQRDRECIKYTCSQIQDGGQRPCWKRLDGDRSATDCPILLKCFMQVHDASGSPPLD